MHADILTMKKHIQKYLTIYVLLIFWRCYKKNTHANICIKKTNVCVCVCMCVCVCVCMRVCVHVSSNLSPETYLA